MTLPASHYSHLAYNLNKIGKKEGSIEQYRMAIKIDPELAVAYMNLAELSITSGNFGKAESLINNNSSRFSVTRDKLISLYLLQMALAAQGKPIEMQKREFDQTLGKDPDFKLVDWSFEAIDSFLDEAGKKEQIPEDRLKIIRRLTEEFKGLF